jgi:peptide/nickel transport system ATP-binding protein
VSAPSPEALLRVAALRVRFPGSGEAVHAVDGVDFVLHRGRVLGLVGESGSGKSLTALSVLQLLPEGAELGADSSVAFLGRQLTTLAHRELRALRGADLAMVFQEPMSALNPVMTVGAQIAEVLRVHRGLSRAEARARALALLQEVAIPEPERRLDNFPHELSGGQKQRVMIAMALACDPALLVADEPTTALDVTVQRQILDLLLRLRAERQMAVLFISHDLGVIAEIADEVAVMHRGRVVEHAEVRALFASPKHPYTRGLIACRPRAGAPWRLLPTIDDFLASPEGRLDPAREAALREGPPRPAPSIGATPLLEVRRLSVRFPTARDWLGRPKRWFQAVDDVSFQIARGETVGLVGESGCGKTTLGRAILQLVAAQSGEVRFDGRPLDPRETAWRREAQIVFQDPFAALNPRQRVGDAILEPLEVHEIGPPSGREARVLALLDEVGLSPAHRERYPHELSGGQRQRACIARALSVEPRFLVCDEAVSALDVSVQAQVLNLLKTLQAKRGLTYLFISHDLAVVRFMADRVMVMQAGRIVEEGASEAIYHAPRHPYTQALLAAVPRGDPALRLADA